MAKPLHFSDQNRPFWSIFYTGLQTAEFKGTRESGLRLGEEVPFRPQDDGLVIATGDSVVK